MNVNLDCFPCFMRQVVIAVDAAKLRSDGAVMERAVKSAIKDIESADMGKSPAHLTTFMHRSIRAALKCDPFEDIKREYNQKAMAMFKGFKGIIAGSPDPLMTASRLAIAGNVIDFGIFTSVDMEGTAKRALEGPLEVDDYDEFRRAVEGSGDVLYLLDNCGEIAFDRLLIEELVKLKKRVTAVVKAGPVINDVTMVDARQTGLTDVCEVIDNGSDAVGTILEFASNGFKKRFNAPGALIISKGQGNFETLMHEKRNMFFMFQSKCEVVSRILGLDRGSMLLLRAMQ